MFSKLKSLSNFIFGGSNRTPDPEPAGAAAAGPQEEALDAVDEVQGQTAPEEETQRAVTEHSEEVEDAARQAADQDRTPHTANALEDLKSQLENSKTKAHSSVKGIFGKKNSDAYETVLHALKSSLESTQGAFTRNAKENRDMLQRASFSADALIAACKIYIAKNASPSSSAGKKRLQKITQILELAQMDQEGLRNLFSSIKSMPVEQQEQLTWNQILSDVRSAPIVVENIKKKKTYGDVLKKGDLASRGLDGGLFTPELIARRGGTEAENSSLDVFNDNANYKTDEATDNHEDASRNITGRNVATSRVANLLGIGGLIAQSKTVKVYDQNSQSMIRGNLMEWADGKEAEGLIEDKRDAVASIGGDDIKKREEAAKNMFAPGAMRDLMNLQVLDYICGQKDRHDRNFFMQTDDSGKITGIKGIDNDMCFGLETDMEKAILNSDATFLNKKLNKMQESVDSQENLTIPVMDEALAKAILDLKPDELKYAIEDLIEPDAVEAAVTRLRKMQTAIKKTMTTEPDRITSKWDAETHKKIMSGAMIHRAALNEKDGTDESLFKIDGNSRFNPKQKDQLQEWVKGNSLYSRTIYNMMSVAFSNSTNDYFYFDTEAKTHTFYANILDQRRQKEASKAKAEAAIQDEEAG